MKTTIHSYRFNIDNAKEAAEYAALCEKLSATKGRARMFNVLVSSSDGGYCYPQLDGTEITLETDNFITDDQWNSAPIEGESESGLRVFDWAEGIYLNRKIKAGHYLDITQEMIDIRANILKCGYCGNMESKETAPTFCPSCIDSEYLDEKTLPLTRMMPAGQSFAAKRGELSKAESAVLVPKWREAQTNGITERGKKRIAAKRQEITDKAAQAIANAKMEEAGFNWLMDNGLPQMAADNVIFYSHKPEFGFGWRKPLDKAALDTVLEIISEFPFPYGIKCADGRELNGY